MKNYKDTTIRTYNQLVNKQAQKFHDLSDFEKRQDIQTFLGMFHGENILDLGSGPGEHAAYFKSKGFDVTCVDLSEEMIKLCREKGLKAQVMDIENLTFRDNSFDGIWAATSLLHMPKKNISSILQKLKKILKTNGVIYVSLKQGTGEKFVQEKDDPEHERYFALWELDEFSEIVKEYFKVKIARIESSTDGKRKLLAFYLKNTNGS